MKKALLLVMAASITLLALGCNSQGGTNADRASEFSDMEKRVNAKALKDNPPPPGEGPGN